MTVSLMEGEWKVDQSGEIQHDCCLLFRVSER